MGWRQVGASMMVMACSAMVASTYGIIALPIENIVVFAVQIGRNIGALPWWITLATAGAVLLVIAVGSERRTGKDKGTAARLRDLR